ncbi:MAG: type II toxin-antitoxin system Phd/YefM family antitoxin [Gammaproteobacteria bacterium]|nr:type II toxin-antitoxin system Phd/YefM family antitoxin [Gammaproteobacteria bacterium]MCH9743621.1 type II toxin-antitoxin system Phd/YefM family antitoxin [Gammaproteobacteria bacterium]
MRKWQLQEAKARFSELVNKALSKGPQSITVRGKPSAVIISMRDYEKLTRKKQSFLKLMQQSPLVGVKLDTSRNKSTSRDIDL